MCVKLNEKVVSLNIYYTKAAYKYITCITYEYEYEYTFC